MKRHSILMKMDHCWKCGTNQNLHIHEVFFGRNKQTSIKEGLCVSLCGCHHNLSDKSPHKDREIDLELKRWAQKIWMEKNNKTIDDFIKLFGKNYILED